MMIRLIILLGILVTWNVSLGQDNGLAQVTKKLEKIKSIKAANDFIIHEPNLNGSIHSIYLRKDTTEFDKLLLSKKTGEVIPLNSNDTISYIGKIIGWDKVITYRASYIFLDNKILSKQTIDSLRTIIIKRSNNGEPFEALAKEFSMDGNSKKGGDLGWFAEGQMVKEFENAIKAHRKGDVHFVDVNSEKWYYVVKNTHLPNKEKVLNVLIVGVKK